VESSSLLPPLFLAYPDPDAWADAAGADIARALAVSLDIEGTARLLLSGGTTPAPVYRALARHALDWQAVRVGLVDERWLPVGDADSNGRLVAESLLHGPAERACFEPMLVAGRSLDEAVAEANASALRGPDAVAVLGMGPDGHTASIFPGMRDYDAALATREDYLAIDASASPVAGAWHTRITLGAAGLARASQRLLLIRGDDKRERFQQALAGDDARALPVRLAFHGDTPLRVHWCP
jgi:6-phosphogluconolactonase